MDPSLPSAPAARVVAGKYRLGALLGRGGRGSVYAAEQIGLGRDVALKLVTERDPDARARFLREARVAAGIHHPGVVQIFDAGVDQDGTPYCAMERLEGETLAERIGRDGPLAPLDAVTIATAVAGALAAVHAAGFLHRDVKPANVFLARREDGGVDPKLIDFGIARRLALEPDALSRVTKRGMGLTRAPTAAGFIVGTPLYLSPEQIMGSELDERCDVYALGATLYEALAGEPPFEHEETAELLLAIIKEEPTPLTKRPGAARVPAALDREVRRALAKEPAQRHASAADFAAALWTALAKSRAGGPAAPARAGRRAWIAGVAAAAVILVVAGVKLRPRPEPVAAASSPPAPTAAVTAAPTATAAEAPSASAQAESTAAPPAPAPTARAKPATPSRAPVTAAAPTAAATAAPTTPNLRMDDLKVPY